MKLEQLEAGQIVTLEVLIGGSSFELKTEVVGTNSGTGVLVKPYVYNDRVVDFRHGAPESMRFALHCIDPRTNGRVVWKNVAVNVVNFRGVDYYAVDSSNFGTIAASSERREDTRVIVNSPGSACMEDGRRFSVSVLDVSDAGVSFIGNANRVTIGDVVEINFADSACNSDFSLAIKAKIVRAEVEKNGILYAGKVIERDNKLLAYLCFKGMDGKSAKASKIIRDVYGR
ncbi:PilZ domain-containing protein [Pseudobutyrivibrio sp. YE44]|uniref:PilZ domain-containing protein n=1 Tax=Pseudobutyrivibrio sp. YE44 TaxID=1520802 RepID=UPI00088F2274|nr:PilZ domain-containing protein [Pseudobutyrivibrio sp. YE44]SDB13161.1 PilZ domain-containing protein [Pseudobutyrivibrio sp. YE44]